MPIRTLRNDPALRARRAAIRAYWTAHPAAPAREVAERFGVSEPTALDHKPHALRSIRPGRRPSGRQMEADAPLAEIAEATGRSMTTTRRFLRSHMQRCGTPPA